jgi:hypothetical protein
MRSATNARSAGLNGQVLAQYRQLGRTTRMVWRQGWVVKYIGPLLEN